MSYRIARLEGQITVILEEKDHSSMPLFIVPSYYINDQGIAEGIIKALEKSKIKLEVEL